VGFGHQQGGPDEHQCNADRNHIPLVTILRLLPARPSTLAANLGDRAALLHGRNLTCKEEFVKKLTLLSLLALVALVVPAQASKPKHHGKPDKPGKSHKCVAHKHAYRVSGTLISGSLTQNSDGTYSGDLTVHVTGANKHAKADKGTDKSYTLDHAKAKLHGESPSALTAGSSVKLKGTITALPKKCDQTGFTPTVTIRRANIKPPKA
jgi:hypothetical protein